MATGTKGTVHKARGAAAPGAKRLLKPTRAERNLLTRGRLIDAAISIVGDYGYNDASVARIAERAGIAQGTFYNHFSSRQELLDLVLPTMTKMMFNVIEQQLVSGQSDLDKEISRFVGYLQFIKSVPGFARVLHEAEFYSPDVFEQHLARIHSQYRHTLTPALQKRGFSERKIDLFTAMLLGIRAKLMRHLTRAAGDGITDEALADAADAYRTLLTENLFEA